MTTTTATSAPAKPRQVRLWLLALITFSGTVAMHIFVPALTVVAETYGATAGAAQLTLSAYIAGLAIGQLIYGPVSDRYGRRPVLMAGMVLYILAGIAAYFAPTLQALIAARFVQALGGCSGLVLGRAIVRDTGAGANAARSLSMMNLVVMAGPGLAPLLGAALAGATGWRSIFVALCGLGLVNLWLIWRRLPETFSGGGRSARDVAASYRHLLGSRRFLGYTVGGAFATTSLYAYVGAAPFIFVNELSRPKFEVGLYLFLNMAGLALGSLLASRLVMRMRLDRLMVAGNLISICGAGLFLMLILAGRLDVTVTVATMMIYTFGAGLTSPAALTEALSVNPAIAGSASGLYGFVQMVIGAACTSLGSFGSNPAFDTALVLTGACVLAQAGFWIAQHGRPDRPQMQPAAPGPDAV